VKVIHIIPDSAVNPRHLYLGSTKEIRCRTEYFKTQGIAFDELIVEHRSDAFLLENLQNLELGQYSAAFFEYPIYPKSLNFLRRKYPHLRLLTRSHNADFYHSLHYVFASLKSSNYGKIPLYLAISLINLRLDYLCARRSDFILSITEWEKNNYWKYFTKLSKIVTVPYFLPSSYSEGIPLQLEKKAQCVCLMSTAQGFLPFLIDAARGFSKSVEKLEDQCPEWGFCITGDFPENLIKLPERVKRTGFLETPLRILAESRAIALLSDYGMGFKTKLLDAIYYKCYVLVTRKLYQRLPVEVQPYCIVVDINSSSSFKDALERCLEPYPEGNPNEVLRSQAFAALDRIIFGRVQ